MKVLEHYPLLAHNTFKMEVSCRQFLVIEQPEEIHTLATEGFFQQPFFILGGGSNVLFTQDFDGTIIHPVFQGIEMVDEESKTVTLRVAAGTEWETLIH